MSDAARAILERLVMALVREDVAGLGRASSWSRNGRTLLNVELGAGRRLSVPVARRYSLARFDLADFPVLTEGGTSRALETPAQLLELLAGTEGLSRLTEEVVESAANLELALQASRSRDLGPTLPDVLPRLADPEFSSLVYYEQRVIAGHPLHPGARLRKGMTADEQRRYGPEWGARPGVALVGVRLEHLADHGLVGRMEEAYPDAIAQARRDTGSGYGYLPVHPWQLERTLPGLYADELTDGTVSPTSVTLPAAATMSLRTMAAPGPYHFKTAINCQTTGAVRTVSANAATNGPIISRLLSRVPIEGSLVVLQEVGGAHFRSDDPVKAKNLAAVLRVSPERHVKRGELAMPAAALIEPSGEGPIAAELVDCSGGDPVAFVDGYAQVLLPPLLRLMSVYGVSLEGHLQNIVSVFREGRLVRVLYRDFGGVRLFIPRLEAAGLTGCDLLPGSATRAADEDDLRNKILYPVFQNHLGELIRCLVRHYDVPEERLWEPVARVCREVYREVDRPEDERALFAAEWDLKAMTTMRLLDRVTDYNFSRVPNPLASW